MPTADFLMRHGEELRHLVVAVVDQRLVDAAEARGAVRRQVFDVERLDDVDHEVGAGDAADAVAVLGGVPVSAAIGPGGRRQRRRHARGRGAGGTGAHSRLAARPRSRRRRRPRRSEICGDRPSGRNPSCPEPCVPWCAPSNELLCGDSPFAAVGGRLYCRPICRTSARSRLSRHSLPSGGRSGGTFRAAERQATGAAKHLIGNRFQRVCPSAKGSAFARDHASSRGAQLRPTRRHPRAAGVVWLDAGPRPDARRLRHRSGNRLRRVR